MRRSGRFWSIAAVGAAAILAGCWFVRRGFREEGDPPGLAPPRVGAVAVADINGDGFADLIVGLPGRDEPRDVPGRVGVWFGGHEGLDAGPGAKFVEPIIGVKSHPGSFGQAVAAVGDVNHDGFADVIVGAPRAGSCTGPPWPKRPPIDGGRIFLLLGARNGFVSVPVAFQDGARVGGRFGSQFRGVGDTDGDGYPEIVVGAEGYGMQECFDLYPGDRAELPPQVPPSLFLVHYQRSGFSPSPAALTQPATADEEIRHPVNYFVTADLDRDGHADLLSSTALPGTMAPQEAIGSGDVNGDGFTDLAVGHADLRRVYFYAGAAGRGIVEPPTATLIGPLRDAPGVPPSQRDEVALSQTSFGSPVVVTDVDRDGFADVVVGAPWVDKVYVYAGSPAGPRQPARQVISHAPHTWFPEHMAAGDFDADGYGDIAIIDHGSEIEDPPRGPRLTVYRGSATGLVTKPALSISLARAVAGISN